MVVECLFFEGEWLYFYFSFVIELKWVVGSVVVRFLRGLIDRKLKSES